MSVMRGIMTVRHVLSVLVVLLCLGSTACVNISTLQTAQALKPGDHRLQLGGGGTGLVVETKQNRDDPDSQDSGGGLWSPGIVTFFEVGYRIGVVENFEVGARLTLPGTLGVDAKYQFVDDDGFAVAVGLGAAYLLNGDSNSSSSRFDLQVPLYISYDVNQYFAFYGAPKYVAVIGTSTYTDDGERTSHTDLTNMVGGTGGVRIGDTVGVFLEGSYLTWFGAGANGFGQGNASFYFTF